jgi:hypothetical protein
MKKIAIAGFLMGLFGYVDRARDRHCPPEATRRPALASSMKGKVIKFEAEEFAALDQLARDSGRGLS